MDLYAQPRRSLAAVCHPASVIVGAGAPGAFISYVLMSSFVHTESKYNRWSRRNESRPTSGIRGFFKDH